MDNTVTTDGSFEEGGTRSPGAKPSEHVASIESQPADGRIIEHLGQRYVTVKEGLAHILVTPNSTRTLDTMAHQARKQRSSAAGRPSKTILSAVGQNDTGNGTKYLPQSGGGVDYRPDKPLEAGAVKDEVPQDVFYNEIMQYNRDISVLAIRAFGEDYLERAKKFKKADKKELGIRRAKGEKQRSGRRNVGGKKDGGGEITDAVPESSPKTAANELRMTEGADALMHGQKRARETEDQGAEACSSPSKRAKTDHSDDQGAFNDISVLDETEIADEDMIECERSMNRRISPDRNQHVPEWEHSHLQIPFKVLDALSASGLRALRYSHELPFVTSVTANDLSAKAVNMIKNNVLYNKLNDKIRVTTGNAIAHMYQFTGQAEHHRGELKYNVIDLDPYGTAVPFLDAAVQALQAKECGLLCVTCTDTAVFASNGYPEKAFSLYGGTPLKSYACHEGGLRLVIHSIAMAAARYGLAIEPLLSLSIDYYARVFVRVRHKPTDVKMLSGKTMMVYNCSGCGVLTPQWIGKNQEAVDKKGGTFFKHGFSQGPSVGECCSHCGFKQHICGPMWGGPLHNPAFIERILGYIPSLDKSTYATLERIEGMLTTALEETTLFSDCEVGVPPPAAGDHSNSTTATKQNTSELSAFIPRMPSETLDHHPFYFSPSALAKCLHCQAPGQYAIRGALRHAGYKAVRTHAAREGVKTDAPWSAIWHVMREWVRQKAPIKEGALKPGQAGWSIMQQARSRPEDAEDGVANRQDDNTDKNMVYDEPATKENGGSSTAGERPRHKSLQKHTFEAVFDDALGRDAGKKLKRFQLNPRANWGPMTKAK